MGVYGSLGGFSSKRSRSPSADPETRVHLEGLGEIED
jgi:hypothetical protein